MVGGFIINKFRGDVSLFDDGLVEITRHTGWRSFGVVPWLEEVGRLPAEDSVVLERMSTKPGGAIHIVVPMLSRIANFDDLDPLRAEPGVTVTIVNQGEPLPADAALIILPGSKSTIGDLECLRRNGWDIDLQAHVRRGGRVLGICGGYQMLGRRISDTHGTEGPVGRRMGSACLISRPTWSRARSCAMPRGGAATAVMNCRGMRSTSAGPRDRTAIVP